MVIIKKMVKITDDIRDDICWWVKNIDKFPKKIRPSEIDLTLNVMLPMTDKAYMMFKIM